MNKTLTIIVVAGVVVIAAGAAYYLASGSNVKSNTASSNNTTSQTPAPQAVNQVDIQNFAFSPADITVKKGTAVTWTNKDSATHTVTETDNQTGPKSDNLHSGQSYSFTYNAVGTFKYNCSMHPSMVGSVTVAE